MADDIDILAATDRQRVVAKALRPHLPDKDASDLLKLAGAALLAVDEDINEQEITGQLREAEATVPSIEVLIRGLALDSAARLYAGVDADQQALLDTAAMFAAYVRGDGAED